VPDGRVTKLRKGHLVRLIADHRRRGRIVSANVNALTHLGEVVVEWRPGVRLTAIHPSLIELDPDAPLRGRAVTIAGGGIDDWLDDL
jgi:hypothetical protein